jgi:hypothetical protein
MIYVSADGFGFFLVTAYLTRLTFGSFCFRAYYQLLGIAAARPDGFLEADDLATAFWDVC